ncbi:ATP-binding protein [Elizabethkingia meningoseptica]|uniref:ATP-binding protein n=1 Tax=Elizabethkingia meningoseptica TaxID=238 RepID=UPI0023B057AB|nr:ATP-binding protein [Elizabethkingia meningoseptica]MDE5432704.1 ATP-binding protein [Elizabethkingia meningoseptica]
MNDAPFNHSHFIGYINHVSPQFVKLHFPSSVLMKSFSFYGEELKGGLVGSYVVIEGEKYGFLGKISEISLPEKERLELSEKSFNTKEFHPSGKIEVLMSFDLFNPYEINKGLNSLPLIGAKVFICSSKFISNYFKAFGVKPEHKNSAPIIKLGKLTYDNATTIELSQQALFSRHCAIVGTTGGGKSYTVSKLIEGIINNKGKAIIIDPTGEYSTYDEKDEVEKTILINDSYFSYKNLTIGDFFVLFKPSGQVQQPILLEAIKSLKISHCLKRDKDKYEPIEEGNKLTLTIGRKQLIIENGCIIKKNNEIKPFLNAHHIYKSEIESSDNSEFDITKLHHQIINECFQIDGDKWRNFRDDRNFGNSTSLLMRINNIIGDEDHKKMFGFDNNNENDLISIIENFLKNDSKNILRIGFENIPYNFQVREILANSIGKYLLNMSRRGEFKNKPLILFVDEAHQFLNKKVKDEYFESTELNSYDMIAKESRKYGLFLCLATQMPRDIPNGTLSQIGTFISHRLINHQDKEAVSNACSSANRETLAFLPILGSGEAILMGVDFPMPVMFKVDLPMIEPDSKTPLFSN